MAAKHWVLAVAFMLAGQPNEAAVVVSHVLGAGSAVNSVNTDGDLSVSDKEHARHKQALDDLMKNMTLSSAMGILAKNSQASPTLLAFVRQALVTTERSRLRIGGAQKNPEPAAPAATAKATEELNDMIYEVQTKYEVEHRKCCEYERTKRFMLEQMAQDIALFNAEAAQGRAGVLAAQTQLTIANGRVPKLRESLDRNDKSCQNAKDVIKQDLSTVLKDIETLSSILSMTNCGNGTQKVAAKMMLVSSAAEMVHSAATKDAILQTLHEERELIALQEAQQSKPRRLLAHVAAHKQRQDPKPKGQDQPTTTVGPGSPNKPGEAPANADKFAAAAGKAFDPFKLAPGAAAAGGPCSRPAINKKCAISEDASCQRIQERFLTLQMATIDKRDALRREQVKITQTCDATAADIRSQLSQFQTQAMDQQTLLSRWTKVQNEADEQSRLKNVQRQAMDKEFKEMTITCHSSYAAFEAQECGLRKIRGELAKLNNSAPYFQDCDVSKWSPEACSVSCGGGTQRLSRSIITQPQNGVKCLPLSRMDTCNPQSCPVNCKLGDWQSWSACTAECGGGVMQRARDALVKPRFGGLPCADTSESRTCNLQNCDQDCVLNDWSAWTSCSKQCNSGRQRRVRTVKTPARGTGKCPGEQDAARRQFQECNKDACPQDLQCKSPNLDVVLVIDGATSQGERGWNATKAAMSMLVQGLAGTGGARVAVLTFSGPESWSDLSKCTGEADGKVDVAKDCKLSWVSHFATNGTSLGQNISALAFPMGTRLTSSALGLAEAQLSLARREASAVVVVVTSGTPLSKEKTLTMSMNVRKRARLMYVTLTDTAPVSLYRTWSSEPAEENVRAVATFDDLQRRQTVDGIISDICPQVAARVEYTMVGGYSVHSGTAWSANPQPLSCPEACVVRFGAGTYRCSTQPGTLNYQAFLSGWGDPQYCTKPASDTWKVGAAYNCGSKGCSYSAMVVDHCGNNPQNYCWRFAR